MPNQFLDPGNQVSVNNYVDLRTALVLQSGEDPLSINLGTAPAVIYLGRIFQRDDNDTTSVHDGTSILVDNQGTRFKVFGINALPKSVIGNSSPPANPNIGDAYLIFGGDDTGAFAGRLEHIAVWTQWEWRFIFPQEGTRVLNEANNSNYYFIGGIWQQGDPSPIADTTIKPANLVLRSPTPIQGVLNDPPALIPNEIAYLIGANPTGIWASRANNVVYGDGLAWSYIAPRNGEFVYNTANNRLMVWRNGSWEHFIEDTVRQRSYLAVGRNDFVAQNFGSKSGWRYHRTVPVGSLDELFTYRLFGLTRTNPQVELSVRRTTSSSGEGNSQQIRFLLGAWNNTNEANPNLRLLAVSPFYTATRGSLSGGVYPYTFRGDVEFKHTNPNIEDIQVDGFIPLNGATVGNPVTLGIVVEQDNYAPFATGGFNNGVIDTNFGNLIIIEKQVRDEDI